MPTSDPRYKAILTKLGTKGVPDRFVPGCVAKFCGVVESCIAAIQRRDWQSAYEELLRSCRMSQILRLELGELNRLDELRRSTIQLHLSAVLTSVDEASDFLGSLSADRRHWAAKAVENIRDRLNEVRPDEDVSYRNSKKAR
jgi:hypothetical protein